MCVIRIVLYYFDMWLSISSPYQHFWIFLSTFVSTFVVCFVCVLTFCNTMGQTAKTAKIKPHGNFPLYGI